LCRFLAQRGDRARWSPPARPAPQLCGKVCTDKVSGSHVTRPELTKCLKALKADDVLTV